MFQYIDQTGKIVTSAQKLDLRRAENAGLRMYNRPRFISPDGVIHERIGFIDLRRKGTDYKRI